jgi:DNA-binding transcriptional LysR family regulator
MHLERLGQFLRIVETGSMNAAARAVHLTQPALSRSLRLLEEELGVALFHRRGRGLVLTPAGRALVPRAQALIDASGELAKEVGRSAERGYYDLRLGAVDSVAAYLLPGLIAPLRRAFPTLALKVSTARTRPLLDGAGRGQLDLAIVAHSGAPPGVRARRLGGYQLAFFGRKDLYPGLFRVRREAELLSFPVVEIQPGHGEPGRVPAQSLSYAAASHVATVKALVLAGFGVGDLPTFIVDADEARRLVKAPLPHDPDCALYLVGSPRFVSEAERRIERHIGDLLAAALARPRRKK